MLSHVIAKDGSRFVIPLSERSGKCLVSTEDINRELNFIGWFTMSVVHFSQQNVKSEYCIARIRG